MQIKEYMHFIYIVNYNNVVRYLRVVSALYFRELLQITFYP